MGVKHTTITKYYCDVCDAECTPKPSHKMITHYGDRDLAASYVYVQFKHFDPMSNDSEFVICENCKKDYLKKYLTELEK
jgi:hypothetical protein